MAQPRFRIANLMVAVAVAALIFAVVRAIGGTEMALFSFGMCCWPILTLSAVAWVFDLMGVEKPTLGGRPRGGHLRRRSLLVLILVSLPTVILAGYAVSGSHPEREIFIANGVVSLLMAAGSAATKFLVWLTRPRL